MRGAWSGMRVKGYPLKKWVVLGLGLLFLLAPLAGLGPAYAEQVQLIDMEMLGSPDGHTLKTVKTERRYSFNKPKGWKAHPNTKIHVVFQHSASLLPERSSLNVLVNNRILKTIRLGQDNVTPTALDIPIPVDLIKDKNILSFQVDQHYTYKCEDPFSEELWTTVLPDTHLKLAYTPQQVQTDLAHFPYPLIDELNTYEPSQVGYVLPASLSDKSLEAAGVVVTYMGQQASWRPIEAYLADTSDVDSPRNLVLVGTPDENPAIAALEGSLDVPLHGNQFVDHSGSALPADYGIIQLVPNPSYPTHAILVVSGNSPEGVRKAAKVLAEKPMNRLLVGQSTIVKEYNPGPQHPYRAWKGFVQRSGDTFANLGLETLTARGITALPLYYQLKLMPDLFVPAQRKAKLHTVYSYSSQLDASLSKLEVRLNGKAIKSVPLSNPAGETQKDLMLEIPAEELHTYNDLEYQFHVYPEKYDMCRYVTDAHIWGTVHNTSWVEVPAETKTAVPDVGLINDGGFPFSVYQDFSQVSVVMPEQPSDMDLSLMIKTLNRLGRESASRGGISLAVHHANSLPDDAKKNHHLLVLGSKDRNSFLDEFKSKANLLIEGSWATLEGPDKRLAELNYTPAQGILEEIVSPWNNSRVALMVTGQTDEALEKLGRLFDEDALFRAIEPGNIAVINESGPKSLVVGKQGDARFLFEPDLKDGQSLPAWVWVAVGFFALIGLLSIVRFIFGR